MTMSSRSGNFSASQIGPNYPCPKMRLNMKWDAEISPAAPWSSRSLMILALFRKQGKTELGFDWWNIGIGGFVES
jgi:hypothetical protein